MPTSQIDALFAPWNRPGSPGCAVGVVQEGELVFARGYGEASLEHGVAITPATVFDIGSNAKQFTAAAVALLAEEGALGLDDPVRHYLPTLPDYAAPITLRHLLHHTSGLRDYLGLGYFAGHEPRNVYTGDDLLRLLGRQAGLNFTPGRENLYSNSGYVLLALVVEKVSGMPFNRFLAQRIFALLGMASSRVHAEPKHVVPHRATAYAVEGGRFVIDDRINFVMPGSGQILSTVEDLSRWVHAFETDALGNDGFMARLLIPGVLANGTPLPYAFGLSLGTFDGHETVHHGGLWGGFRAELLRVPAERLAVICLANLSAVPVPRVTEQILKHYLAPRPAKASERRTEVATLPAGFEPAVLADLEGTFASDDGKARFTISRSGHGAVLLSRRSGRTYTLDPSETPGDYRILEPPLALRIAWGQTPGQTGRRRLWIAQQNGDLLLLDEVPATPPAPEVLAGHVGRYRSDELAVTYNVRFHEGRLHLVMRERAIHLLRPVTETLMTAGLFSLTFEQDDQGRSVGFFIDAGRVRGLRFQRLMADALPSTLLP